MYITRKNAIHVPFSLTTSVRMAEEEALLDSGATHNFMDRCMAKRLGLGTQLLPTPRKVRNADGTNNQAGTLTRYTDLQISFKGITEIQRFYITDLGSD
jgi:predicted aspartyl protease